MSKRYTATILMGLSGLMFFPGITAAEPWAPPLEIDCGFHFNVTCRGNGCKPRCGPWYAYFPYEAHFQMPAPVGPFPHWPVPPQSNATAPAPVPSAGTPRQAPSSVYQGGPSIQPVGYYQYSGVNVPSYWYGR